MDANEMNMTLLHSRWMWWF